MKVSFVAVILVPAVVYSDESFASLKFTACESFLRISGLEDAWPLWLRSVGVAFRGDNGKYLSRIHRGGINKIEKAKNHKDPYTRFLAVAYNGKLVLRTDNKMFLSRIRRGSIEFIEAAKRSPDIHSQFTVHNQPDGTVVLRADNEKYMSGVRRGSIDYFEAEKDTIDV